MKNRWQIILGVLVSLVFVWLAVQGLHLQEMWFYLRTANYVWLLPGIAVYFLAVVARTWRWHYLLRPVKSITVRKLFPIVCIGYFGNNVFPARLGELLRAYVLRKDEHVPMMTSLAPIIIERVFDGLVMLLFVFVALPFVGADRIPNFYRGIVVGASLLFFGALVVFLWAAISPRRADALYHFFANRFLPARFRPPVEGFYKRFMDGLAFLRNGRDVLMVFVTSIVIWLLETVKYWFVMHAFVFFVPFVGLMLMNGVVNLTTTLPSAPGYIGTFEIGARVLEALGVPYSLAFGYTVVLHAALWFPITALGGYYMLREGIKWREAANVKQDELATSEGSSA